MHPEEPASGTASTSMDEADVQRAKARLRRIVSAQRQRRSVELRRADDVARTRRLTERLAQERPSTVAAYLSVGSEPGSEELLGWLTGQGIRVLVPLVAERSGRPDWSSPNWAEYAGPVELQSGPGTLAIRQPVGMPLGSEALAEASVVICPGLAGDLRGQRLGRGGGWYDRALVQAGPHSRRWLLLNDDEVLDDIPTTAHDQRVHEIITPTRFLSSFYTAHTPAVDKDPG